MSKKWKKYFLGARNHTIVHTCTIIKNAYAYTHKTSFPDNIPLLTERKKNTEKTKANVHKMESHSIKSQLGIQHHLDSLSVFPGKIYIYILLSLTIWSFLCFPHISDFLCLLHSLLMTLSYISGRNNSLKPHRNNYIFPHRFK